MKYALEFQGKAFTPDGQANIPNIDAQNKAVEASELANWATCPDHACFYVTGGKITTWLGTVVGHILRSNTYRNNFGSRTTSLLVRGTNGAKYYGRYGSDWSELCNLRKSKA